MVGHPGTPAPLAPRNARHSAMPCHALHGATQAHARLTELAEFFSGERALTRVGKDELVETAAVTLPLRCRDMTVTLPLQAGRDGRRPQQRRRPTALPGTHGPGRSPSTLGSGPSLSLCRIVPLPPTHQPAFVKGLSRDGGPVPAPPLHYRYITVTLPLHGRPKTEALCLHPLTGKDEQLVGWFQQLAAQVEALHAGDATLAGRKMHHLIAARRAQRRAVVGAPQLTARASTGLLSRLLPTSRAPEQRLSRSDPR